MAEKTDANEKPKKDPDASSKTEAQEEEKESYVSDQLAVKTWSVIARFLHEGWGIITLRKAWDSEHKDFVVVPWYADQQPEAMKPDVWMSWRHELKAPLGGHTYIRDFAEVVDTVSLSSVEALEGIDPEHALTGPEARRRFERGEPGLVALVLRIYHLPRSYKLYNLKEQAGEGDFVPLPFDVELEDLTPAVEDEDFERRYQAVKAALEP